MKIRRSVTAGVLALAALAAFAQTTVPEIQSVATRPAAFPRQELRFEVRGTNGELVQELAPGSVSVEENGRRIVGQLAPVAQPVAYLVAIDTSGSMKKLLPGMRKGLAAFVSGLDDDDRAALATFNDELTTLAAFTAERQELIAKIDSIETGGRFTQLYYAVSHALELFRVPGTPERRILVVVSDGKDEGTSYKLDDVIAAAKEAGVQVYALGITSTDPRDLLNLRRMAEATGGHFWRVDADQSWADELALLRHDVQARWSFTWTSTLPRDGKTHPVQLAVALDGLTINKTLSVDTPAPLAAAPKTKKPVLPRWIWWASAGALLLLIALVAVLVRASRRRKRREGEQLEARLAKERESHERTAGELRQKLSEATQKFQVLEDKLQQPAPAPVATASVQGNNGSAGAAATKRRTIYRPGAAAAPLATSPARQARLQVRSGPLAGSNLPLLDGETFLGRGEDNHVVLDDERVSHRHAVIAKRDGAYWLQDLGSTNGTFVDGRPIAGGLRLERGNEIRIGGALLVYMAEP